MSKATMTSSTSSPWRLSTWRIVLAGVLAAITIVMGIVPGIGFIPVPNITASATIEHVPTILGGVLGGPIVGMLTGLVFGLVSFFRATTPIFKDPLVAIVPRILIGLTSWLVYAGLARINRSVAAFVAGIVGAATNTVFVLGFAIWRGYLPLAIVPLILPQAIAEAIIAAILTTVIAGAVQIVRGRYVRAPETKSRDQLPY
ncbi:MAG TPA: ECF transporter S component [Ktedonobacteraceae bacterium]|nr:ECF transporter S component [Ktedonobacteraceae bacterium]